MLVPSQARKLEVVKKTQYIKGKSPKFLAFPCLAWFFPYIFATNQPLENHNKKHHKKEDSGKKREKKHTSMIQHKIIWGGGIF